MYERSLGVVDGHAASHGVENCSLRVGSIELNRGLLRGFRDMTASVKRFQCL